MEVPSLPPPRDAYARMRRLSDAIDDPDSSFGQRLRWTDEYVDLSGELVGSVGARAAAGAELLDRSTRRSPLPDGHAPRLGGGGADLYL